MSALNFIDIELHNFKSFSGSHSFEIDRGPGLFYVIGKNKVQPKLGSNGSGKSTLTSDALMWCLWGKTERDPRPANAVVPWTIEKGGTSVALRFKRFGKIYTLKRSRKPNELTLTNAKSDSVRTIEQSEVESLIGMSEEMFRRTVILGQFGSLFLDLRPEEQSRMFNEALDLEVWLRAAKLATEKRKDREKQLQADGLAKGRLEGRIEELTTSLAREKEASKTFHKLQDVQLAEINRKVRSLDEQLLALLAKAAQERPKTAKTGTSVADILEADAVSAWASWRGLAQELADHKAAAQAKATEQLRIENEIRQYENAIKGNKACPACGQQAPVKQLQEKLNGLSTIHKRLDKEIGALDKRIDTLIEKTAKLEIDGKKLSSLVREAQSLESEMEALNSKKKMLTNSNPHEASIASIKERLAKSKEEIEDLTEKMTETEKQVEICDYWSDAFRDIRLNLIDQILAELEMAVLRHAEGLGLEDWRIEFQTERTTQAGTTSTAFNILLLPPDQIEPIRFASYSGGESQRWQLAVAFGLSEVILERAGVSPSLLVLDEPTKGLSEEGVDNLLEHLAELAKELKRSVYVVEHHSLARGNFDETITILKTDKGSSIQQST